MKRLFLAFLPVCIIAQSAESIGGDLGTPIAGTPTAGTPTAGMPTAGIISIKPEFENNYIKMKSTWTGGHTKCGGLTITPKKQPDQGKLHLRAVRYSDKTTPSIMTGQAPLEAEGMRVKYDWAGKWPTAHHRIYCVHKVDSSQYGEVEKTVDCKEYVDINDLTHDANCHVNVGTIVGTHARYEPLNMSVKTTESPKLK